MRGIAGGLVDGSTGQLPPHLRGAFDSSLAESMLLPAGVLLVGFAAAVMFIRPVAEQGYREQFNDTVAVG